MTLLMPDDFIEMINIYWRVEQAVSDVDNPLLEGDMPWDAGGIGVHGTVLRDPIDGLYKAWVVTTPPDEYFELLHRHQDYRRLCYYEITDGVHRTRPKLPNSYWGDHESMNIVFNDVDEHSRRHGSARGLNPSGTQYASVSVDPDNQEWPYEMFVYRGMYGGEYITGQMAMFFLRSRDGRTWEKSHGPIMGPFDVDVCFVYPASFLDLDRKEGYVAYYRHRVNDPEIHQPSYEGHGTSTRVLFRVESRDGKEWVNNELIIIRDGRDHHDTQYMELVPQRVPVGYIGIVSVYHPITQTQNLRLAASRDGRTWWFPDRRPCLDNPPLGEYGGGMIWQSKNLVAEGDLLYIYYGGSEGLHRPIFDTRGKELGIDYHPIGHEKKWQIRFGGITDSIDSPPIGPEKVFDRPVGLLPFNSAMLRSSWRMDRLYALIPSAGGPTLGVAVTRPRHLPGGQLHINFLTQPPKKSRKPSFDEGYLQVELLDDQGSPIQGFTRDDCPRLSGDHHALVVRWAGGDLIPDHATKVKFYIKRAFLYGFESSSAT